METKKAQTSHFFCRKRRGRTQPRCRGGHSWVLLERQRDAWCLLPGQGGGSPVPSVGPWAVALRLLPQPKCLMVPVATVAQPCREWHAGCCASSQGVCFLAHVERLPVAVIPSDGFPNSWETKSGLFLCRVDEFDGRFSVVGSPCGYGRLQTPFGGQVWLCCLGLCPIWG